MKRPKTLTQYELNKLTTAEQVAYYSAHSEYRRLHPPSQLQTLTRARNFNIGRCTMLKYHIGQLKLPKEVEEYMFLQLDVHKAKLLRLNEEQKSKRV